MTEPSIDTQRRLIDCGKQQFDSTKWTNPRLGDFRGRRQTMTNHPNRSRYARWINSLEGLSDEPLPRAAQIQLAALDRAITSGNLEDDTAAVAAYEALQAALA
jgi:hypothetical protein